ncbi:GDSL esterase/lipase At1g29670-like [Humulus lupulus]|uniref:GDSL esterase/lipase At1g29670-like n=1 Tax=Humulus lupulus TaxID=3486 RepID=UPI002B4072A3|nr:GDSL esterase/lipase At1g29670-like [Humulus lupulus]
MEASEMKSVRLVVMMMMMMFLCVSAKSKLVPCLFIFGDSLADNGNNNRLNTSAKANYKPYGIDFLDSRPTGRFTNGRTTVDIIAQLLGFNKFIPAYATLNSSFNLLSGANYASGGSGILRQTGTHMGQNICLKKQIKHHQIMVSRISDLLGSKRSQELLNKCLYWVEMGNNDYINNYFVPWFYSSGNLYTPQQFALILIQKYRHHVMELYNYGARMIALVGLGQIGCTPNAIWTYGTSNGSTCVSFMDDAVQLFNERLVTLVDELNNAFVDTKYIYINSYEIGSSIDPIALGFKVWNVGCCGGLENGQCKPLEIPCENRREYVFWDSFHPTEAYNFITASKIYKAYNLSYSYPMDISDLVHSFEQINIA